MDKRYNWLLFDADHTLLDFDGAEIAALKKICSAHNVEYHQDILTTYQHINRRLWKQLEEGKVTVEFLRGERFRQFVDQTDIGATPEEVSDIFIHELREGRYLIDGAYEIISALAPHYRMAIVTNGLIDTQRRRFEVNEMDGFFEHIIVSQEAGVAKPDPAYFDHACKILGDDDRGSMLVIGDNIRADVAGAMDSGMDACWYNPHGFEPVISDSGREVEPTLTISRLSELSALIP